MGDLIVWLMGGVFLWWWWECYQDGERQRQAEAPEREARKMARLRSEIEAYEREQRDLERRRRTGMY